MPVLNVVLINEVNPNFPDRGWYLVPEEAPPGVSWLITEYAEDPTSVQQAAINAFTNSLNGENEAMAFMEQEMGLADAQLQLAYNSCYVDCNAMVMNGADMPIAAAANSIEASFGEVLADAAEAAL